MTTTAPVPVAMTAAITGPDPVARIRLRTARAACAVAQAIGRGATTAETQTPLRQLAHGLVALGITLSPPPTTPPPEPAPQPVPDTPPALGLNLTQPDIDVLTQLANGLSNAQIGRQFYVTEHTIKTRLRLLYRKLGARDRGHAVAIGFRLGVLS